MRISDSTRYPHPVLSPFSDDYANGQFNVSFAVSEDLGSGALTLRYDVIIDEPCISELVYNERATVGCIVVSLETYYIKLHKLDWKTGFLDFPAGALFGEVGLRPIIWLNDETIQLSSTNINPEFDETALLARGNILAIDIETIIDVGNAKLTPLESIFELVPSPNVLEGRVAVKLDGNRIAIVLGPKTFSSVNTLRGQEEHLPAVTASIYLPVVMEVLDTIRSYPEEYIDFRWYKPFHDKCNFKGVSLAAGGSSLEGAQILLEDPLFELCESVSGEKND